MLLLGFVMFMNWLNLMVRQLSRLRLICWSEFMIDEFMSMVCLLCSVVVVFSRSKICIF